MSYDSRIILGAQQFDLAGAMNAGLEMAARQKQFDQQNALANLYKTQGANILAGDQNALNALAGFDPAAAMGIQSQRQSMAYATEDQEFDRAAAQREAERYAKEVGAEKAAADAAELRANTMQALAAPTPEAFDAMMIANGRPDMVGQWENREMLAVPYLELADALDMIAPKAAPLSPEGKLAADIAAGFVPEGTTKTPGVVVNTGDMGGSAVPPPQIGSIPQGFQAIFDPATNGYRMERIPGGPEDRTAADAAAAAGKVQQADIALGKIRQAQEILNNASIFNPATGFGAQTAATIGGTNAANFKTVTDTIEANIAFDALAAMREASPTGGALGAISERELTLLGATLASLSQAQSPEQAAKHLAELEAIYTQIMEKAAAYPNAAQFGFGGGTAGGAASEISDEDLLRMYGGE